MGFFRKIAVLHSSQLSLQPVLSNGYTWAQMRDLYSSRHACNLGHVQPDIQTLHSGCCHTVLL